MSGESVTKRLHVGGITQNITTQHLKDRFASFGKVHEVDELAPDAFGQKRPFTFLTIEITPSQLKKCLNIMSGSMWRGTQLRIAEAKTVYTDRLDKERNPPKESVDLQLRKRKRRQRTVNHAAGIGKEAQDMRMITAENYSKKKFWSMDMDGHLIRPIAMRPSHPLPLLPKAESSDGPAKRLPPTRARRRVINPRLWKPSHLDESSLTDDSVEEAIEGTWEWHEMDEDEIEDEGEDVVLGHWRLVKDGEVLREQVVRSKRRRVEGGGMEAELEYSDDEGESESGGSDLFGRRTNTVREPSPLFGDRTGVVVNDAEDADEASSSRSSSPFFTSRPAPESESGTRIEDGVEDDEGFENDPNELDKVELSEGDKADEADDTPGDDEADEVDTASSPLFPTKSLTDPIDVETSTSGPSSPLFTPKPLPQVKRPTAIQEAPKRVNVNIPDPLRRQVIQERSRDLSLLDSILNGANSFGDDVSVPRPSFGGFRESDDEDDEDDGVLRLRGGAPDEDDDEDMSDDSSDESDSTTSSSSASSSSGDSSDSGSDSDAEDIPAAKPQSTVKPSNKPLKDMFAPTAPTSGGFSLMASLDPDLELDELDVPLAPSIRPNTTEELQPLEPLLPSSNVEGLFDPDPSIPLFFPTTTSFNAQQGGKKGKDAFADDVQSEDWRGFHKVEGENDELMKGLWEKERGELTRDWKKRHREAKKHRKRRGGVDEE